MDEQEKLEQEASKVVSDEEIRAKFVEDFGFDETADAERLDKLVAKEKSQREITSKAIAAKIKHRNEAEDLRKQVPAPQAKKEETGLSTKDTIAIFNAKVTEPEDVDEVLEYAQFKKISVSEALKSDILQTTLAKKAEFRKTASMMNTGTQKPVITKANPETVIDDTFVKGQIPEKGSKASEELFFARRGGRR